MVRAGYLSVVVDLIGQVENLNTRNLVMSARSVVLKLVDQKKE